MKIKLLALLLSALISTNPFFTMPSQATAVLESSNPFAVQDNARNQSIKLITDKYQRSGQIYAKKAYISQNNSNSYFTVKFKDNAALSDIYNCVSHYDYKLLGKSSDRIFRITTDNIEKMKNTYQNIIEYTNKDYAIKMKAVANDAQFSEQWELANMNIPQAWDVTKGSASVKVAVIDTGFYRGHEDISNDTVLSGYDVVNDKPGVINDELGHGTMVTSLIAATTNNSNGIAGCCWNITVVPFKVAENNGDIYNSSIITAIRMAADTGCDVINLSLGAYIYDIAENSAVRYAASKGCIIVAAAGNEGDSDDPLRGFSCYPASFNRVISVASVDKNNVKSYFSQYNSKVDVAAPGEDVHVVEPYTASNYLLESGTSFSSPYVASVAALARSVEKSIDCDYFHQLIKETSTDLGATSRDNYYGWGLINAESIVNAAKRPIVVGVDNQTLYNSDKTITFNKGTATLNGQPFSSGDTVTSSGDFTLIVTDSQENLTTVSFSIDKTPIIINGVEDGAIYNSGRTITFNKGTATLNGKTIQSGYVISNNGEYLLNVKDAAGNIRTASFIIDKTPPSFGTPKYSTTALTKNNVTVTVPVSGSKVSSLSHTFTANGSYTFTAADAAGNKTTKTVKVTNIDKTVPIVKTSVGNGRYTSSNVTVTCSDTNFKSKAITLNKKTIGWPKNNTFTSQGAYYVTVYDKAGNKSAYSFAIDKTPPTLTAKKTNKSAVTNGSYVNTNVIVAVSRFTSKSITKNGKAVSWPSNGTLTSSGVYVITLKDEYNCIGTLTFTIDKTAPVITVKNSLGKAVSKNSTISKSATFSYSDTNYSSKKITLNGKTLTWPSSNKVTSKGTYVITVFDKAGNKNSFTFKIS